MEPDIEFEMNPYDSFMRKHLQHYGYYTGRNQGYRNTFTGFADWQKNYSYSLRHSSDSCDSDSDSDNDKDNKLQDELLRTTQLVYNYEAGKMVPKLREPRNLYAMAKELGPQQAARWPADIQVLDMKIKHIRYIPPEPELLYKTTGMESSPMARGEENGGRIVYLYDPKASYFSRSRVGGSKNGCDACAVPLLSDNDVTLIFESRFESGNLAKAVRVGEYSYELWLRYDLYTNKHTQWFYFRVTNTRPNVKYRFTVVNFMKPDSLYNYGMKPMLYSEKDAAQKKIGWVRRGTDIKYFKNNLRYETPKGSSKPFYSLTWCVELKHGCDTVYFAHCYPYTYTDLQDYLLDLSNDSEKIRICKQRVLCRTLAGNLVYVLTITSPSKNPEDIKHKKAVVVTSRVHPGESNASWMMKGFLDFLTGNSADAKLLRDSFVFKIVPMLNPDGVIVGNYRCSLAGRDLNRNYKTVLKDAYPSVWQTKNMIKKLLQERDIIVYCDLHGHSRKQNVFIYGCENRHNPERRLRERIFPSMLARNASDKFSFECCKFKVQKSKEGTGRIVMWNMGIMNSFTMEATFCGSTLGKKKGQHFSMADFEAMGYHFCDSLLDYCDPDHTKANNILFDLEEKMKIEILTKLNKEGVTTEDIDLSEDYTSEMESSDGGSDSSVSDGPPVHLQYNANRLQKKKKNLKSKKERDKNRLNAKDAKTSGQSSQQDNNTDKKLGHLASHAKQSQSNPQTIKYTTGTIKRPRSIDDRTNNGIPIFVQERCEERAQRRQNEYLEALTNTYVKNGLLNDNAMVHFRYSGNQNVPQNVSFPLEGLCAHHEQAFAAQYMANQLNNNIHNVGDPGVDDIVKSHLTRQVSISPLDRRPALQKHLMEVSAAQQRQQDILRGKESPTNGQAIKQHPNPFDEKERAERNKGSGRYPRMQVPSATVVQYDTSLVTRPPIGNPPDNTGIEDIDASNNNIDADREMYRARSKNQHRSGRRSRMSMVEEEESHLPKVQSNVPEELFNYSPSKQKVQNAEVVDMTETLQSIRNLKQSLVTNPAGDGKPRSATGPKSATGHYIRKLMKETDDDIEELTCKIEEDIELEKRLARELEEDRREFSKSKHQKLPYMKPNTSLTSISAVSNKENNPISASKIKPARSTEDTTYKTWAVQNSYLKNSEHHPRKDSATSSSSKEEKLVFKDDRRCQNDRIENDHPGNESSQSLRIKSAKASRKLVGKVNDFKIVGVSLL